MRRRFAPPNGEKGAALLTVLLLVAVMAVMRSSCSFELIAPMSVFLSSGSPSRSVPMRRVNFSTISSWTFS